MATKCKWLVVNDDLHKKNIINGVYSYIDDNNKNNNLRENVYYSIAEYI